MIRFVENADYIKMVFTFFKKGHQIHRQEQRNLIELHQN